MKVLVRMEQIYRYHILAATRFKKKKKRNIIHSSCTCSRHWQHTHNFRKCVFVEAMARIFACENGKCSYNIYFDVTHFKSFYFICIFKFMHICTLPDVTRSHQSRFFQNFIFYKSTHSFKISFFFHSTNFCWLSKPSENHWHFNELFSLELLQFAYGFFWWLLSMLWTL